VRYKADAGTSVRVLFLNDASAPTKQGRKAEGYNQDGKWVTITPSTYHITVGINWHGIVGFVKDQEVINILEFKEPTYTPPPTLRAIKL